MAGGRRSMRFYDLDNLFGHVVTSGQVVCTNEPGSHPASKGLPPGHPTIDSFLGIPISFNGQVTGMIGLANAPEGYDADLAAALQPLSVALAALIHARELEVERQKTAEELERLATTDELTGLFNRRHFLEQARAALARAERDKLPLSLALLDLDHFKQINDRYGHAGGDAVLRHFSALAATKLRGTDVLARIGGEEFAVLMHNTDAEGAALVLERLRSAIEQSVLEFEGHELKVRVSVGWVLVGSPPERIEELLASADAALYRAKSEGRNRVISAQA
jgi:methyl-accepting chemotaxis protein